MGMGGPLGVGSARKAGVSAIVARELATPAVLVASMLAWIALFVGGVPTLASSLLASVVVVVGLLLLERRLPRPGLAGRPSGTLRSDVAFTATTTVVAMVSPPLIAIPLGRTVGAVLGATSVWPLRLPLWASTVAAVFLADLTSYWLHRLQHTTGESWLWRIHSVHHSPKHFDFWMGARVHPLDVLSFTIVGYGVLAALGAPSVAIEMTAFFASMVGAVHHTHVDTDCGWLNRVLPFADHHVVHHSVFAHDAGNYGNITTVWDQLFGTYRAPTPRSCAPVGAWSLADDYPQGAYAFQILSPFGPFWRRAVSPPARHGVEPRPAAIGAET